MSHNCFVYLDDAISGRRVFFLSRSRSLRFVPCFVVLVFIIILFEMCRFVYLPFWLRCCLRILRYVIVVVQFGIFGSTLNDI